MNDSCHLVLPESVADYPEHMVSVLRDLGDSYTVKSLVTSPPFNVGFTYSEHKDCVPRGVYLGWFASLGKTFHQISSPDAMAWIQLDPHPTDVTLPAEAIWSFAGPGWRVLNQICWVRAGTFPQKDGPEESFGHYTPINSPKTLHKCWGVVYCLAKTSNRAPKLNRLALGVPYKDKSNMKRWNGAKNDLRCRGNVWVLTHDTRTKSEKGHHPCPYPISLVENCLKLQGIDRDGPSTVVLDPFGGSGTTSVAAAGLNLSSISWEIDPKYREIARERLSRCQKNIT